MPTEIAQEAVDIIEDMSENPFPDGCLKMRRYANHYRIRFGGGAYRIVYTVDRQRRVVTIFRARPRATVYLGMKSPGKGLTQ